MFKLLCALEVQDTIIELLISYGTDRSDECTDARRTAREPRRESDQQTRMVLTSGYMLGSDTRKVGDILSEYRMALQGRCRKDLRVRASGQSQLGDRGDNYVDRPKRLSQSGWVHLI